MKMFKKILCMILASMMIISMAACGQKQGEGNGEAGSVQKGTPVRWIAFENDLPGRDEVDAEVKRYVKEKLNIDLEIIWLQESDASTLSTVLASGNWDLANINGNTFSSYVGRNAFCAIDEYVDECVPTAKEALSEAEFAACTKDGKLYGLVSAGSSGENWGLIVNYDLFEEYGIEVPEGYTTEKDLVPLYYECTEKYREAHPEDAEKAVILHQKYLNSWYQYDPLCGSWGTELAITNIPGTAGMSDDDASVVYCPYFTDEYATYVQTLWQMAKDGVIANSSSDKQSWNGGGIFCQPSCGYIEFNANAHGDFTAGWVDAYTSVSTTSTMMNYVNVVSAGCENPEATLKFLELLYSDEYLTTTLKFGIKDIDWADEDNDGVVELLERNYDPESRFWIHWYGLKNASLWSCKTAEGTTPEFMEKLQAIRKAAIGSEHAGFTMDTAPVANEIAACNSVLAKYSSMLTYADFEDPAQFVEDMRNELTANGVDKVVAEVQRQLDEWHANN